MTKGRPRVGRVTFVVLALPEIYSFLKFYYVSLILPLHSLRNMYKRVNWTTFLRFILCNYHNNMSLTEEWYQKAGVNPCHHFLRYLDLLLSILGNCLGHGILISVQTLCWASMIYKIAKASTKRRYV